MSGDIDGGDAGLVSRDDLLALTSESRLETADVPMPELGGRLVRIREMTGSMRNRLEAAMAEVRMGASTKNLEKATAQILASCVLGAGDRPALQETEARRLLERNPKAAYRLRQAIFDLSAIDEEDKEALSEGFDDDQSDGFTSD